MNYNNTDQLLINISALYGYCSIRLLLCTQTYSYSYRIISATIYTRYKQLGGFYLCL